MAKEIAGVIKLQIKGGAANPSPPVGPALGSKGINIMEFCKQFNARTQDKAGKILPVVITYYTDKSFDFVVKTPPVAIQLLELTKLKSGSPEPNRKKVAEISWDQVKEIAQDKMVDMNCFELESAMRMVAGTARSMGITVKGTFPGK
ncbi:MAG TPA: 50S ribosomal protein L11 [Paludibacteraceae bacterium]|jgi:large subunit ribosomal protein L11|nr:50S ribosomal protein L11 [Paludibacteraceae bacterium]OPZ01199.1 MAG: 50S ribosomal protein L11 [Bacteroidetes bacterium ADurb.BinA395]MBP9016217.1 50S ribosomal protein L11 [Paludibacteraceae bacterium]HOF97956.1 50S ribosomal protein L11 [Paludibacteraceae bacterium]HOJ66189.1 50S ribosomal protein L11 [Paludibacteraceae bacterium]